MSFRDSNKAGAVIRIRGARQNNLRDVDLDLPLNELVVVTGVSGSGKSSLVFDTVFAEGQRRYVETFSPYARQFLDRMDKPRVDQIDGVPPAIAIDQTNPVRTSRSTVGTMTELADHLKLLYARAAHLICRQCGQPVRRDTPASIADDLLRRAAAAGDPRLVLCAPLRVPDNFDEDEIRALLERQGYSRIHRRDGDRLEVVQDRFRLSSVEPSRLIEGLEAALRLGQGRAHVHVADGDHPQLWPYSEALHCPRCDIAYAEPTPSLFSFNSPIGACETCRGFGRVIGVDFGLVVPDESKTLADGAVKPWQSKSYQECQQDMEQLARRDGIPLDVPFGELSADHRRWVLEGDRSWRSWSASWPGKWYGVRHFFAWLETKAYKMHIRVLLSRYRSYAECPACHGSRLKPEALAWRLGDDPAVAMHQLMAMPIDRITGFVDRLTLPSPLDEASDLLIREIRSRLAYLQQVGLGYLTLDRQSRTLSGGEVQRINLTTALGTSLVNTLFVLDEPSIGLHPRDIGRILQVISRLRDAGNSLLVVEHDPQLMLAADRLLDIGPGPGERGGTIVAFAKPAEVAADERSLTGDYLAGRRRVDRERRHRPVTAAGPALWLRGACRHNLRGIDVCIPLGHLVCVTGVSGSGKSTLLQDLLHPALCKHFGRPAESPTGFATLDGAQHLADVVMVDQSPIGKSSRSNPVSYVGAWDGVRKLFASLPEAAARGYAAGTFSFNSGNGRCPTCSGSGFEHVEMQFLSDVYLRCPDCDGRRYRHEILALRWRGKSIAEVLELTVTQALAFFADQPTVLKSLAPIADVGLDYLRLGQPVPTLSGGEAQRLKLAGHLAKSVAGARARAGRDGSPTLFLFDEPTTGLHFEDVSRLLGAFDKLLDAGHSLLVIEHNLDIVAASDWLIDLGPEGGEGGGEIVAEGPPAAIVACPGSHTGVALADYDAELKRLAGSVREPIVAEASAPYGSEPPAAIEIRHAREHNLRNISVAIPRDALTVVTGLSGSGKSTLAFDIVFAEGQRRYLESLNAYARQFVQPSSRPDVDAVFGIPPTVAIEQRVSRGGRKSTVATLTEIQPFLRLLYVKLGTQYCPDCEVAVRPLSFEAILARIDEDYRGRSVELLAPLVRNRKGLYADLAKWARGKGFEQLRVDGDYLPTRKWPRLDRYREHSIELPVAMVAVQPRHQDHLREQLALALEHGKGVVEVLPLGELGAEAQRFSTRRACPSCGQGFPEPDPRQLSYTAKHGWCPSCFGTGVQLSGRVDDPDALDLAGDDHLSDLPCPACDGARLNPPARALRFRGLGIHQLAARPVGQVARFFDGLELGARERDIARDLVAEIASRLAFLQRVGLGYLALDRAAPTLSGGEAQRIRLAAQLGSNLRGVCYILDEPTIGLHPRDNALLLDTLEALRDRGNTLLVVEHDEETIRRADHIVDLGPGAGVEGGRVVAQGRLGDIAAVARSATACCLREPLRHPLRPARPVAAAHPSIRVGAAALHNLRAIDVRVPLARLTVVTGVSGSGKSTLARDVIYANLVTHLAGGREPHGCESFAGWQTVGRVLEVDQAPIGKTPRSCPATYIGFWDAIRKLFADTFDARTHGWKANRFSFNTGVGRCPVCEGQGQVTIEMNFLPDVKVQCEACAGARFDRETLSVRWKGRNIAEILAMPVAEARGFFAAHPSIAHPLALLDDVGLGYLTLGQASPTLSGGEAQRLKLVSELAKVRADKGAWKPEKHTLYVLDEPTVGLHMADTERLIHVLHRLVDSGHSVLVIEHDLDLIAEADWIIDLGPEGGEDGGKLVCQGPPRRLRRHPESHTGRYLERRLRRSGGTR